MRSRLLITIACLLSGLISFTQDQKIDSLWMKFDSTDEELQHVITGIELAEALMSKTPDSAFLILERIEDHPSLEDHIEYKAQIYNVKGRIYKTISDYSSELEAYLHAKSILEDQEDFDTDSALALKYVDLMTGVSVNYLSTNKFNEAIDLLNELKDFVSFLELDQNSPRVKRHHFVINLNIGSAYLNMYEYEDASYFYSLALNYLDKEDKLSYAVILNNLGIIAKDQGDYLKAEEYLIKALEIRREEEHYPYIAQTLNNTGSMWVIREEPEKALPYFLEVLDLAEEHIIPLTSYTIAHIYLHGIYANMGDFEKAYEYAIDHINLNDSLTRARNVEALTRMETKARFESSLREYQLREQEMELKQKRKELIYGLVIGITVLSIVVLILFYTLQQGKLRRHRVVNERNLLKRKNLEYEKDKLELELDFKDKELATNVMYLARTNEFINSISEKLLQSKHHLNKENQPMIDRVINELQQFTDQDVWQEFEVRFQQVHSDFYTKLNEQFPDLTANEKKLCAFLKLNMTTKEISALTYQTLNSITVARSRLRKKLGIDKDENLIGFLENL